MKCIDAHAHVDFWPAEDLTNFSLAGGKAIVGVTYIRTYYPYAPIATPSDLVLLDPEVYFYFWRRQLIFETKRLAQYGGIKLFVAVGINPFAPTKDFDKVLDKIPEFLAEERVVAVGETGLDYRMKAPDPKTAEEVLRKEFIIAKKHDVPVILHTPPTRKEEFVKKYFEIADGVGLSPDRLVIDHSDESIIKLVLDHGSNVGLTVQPWREMVPEKAAKAVQQYGTERILADTDSYNGYWMRSDSLGVPKLAAELLKLGMREEDVEKVVFKNAIKLYNLKL